MKFIAQPRSGSALPAYFLAALVPLLLSYNTLDPSSYSKLAATCVLIAVIPIWWSPRLPTLTGSGGVWGNPVLIALSVFIVLQTISLLRSNLIEEGVWTVLLRALPGAVAFLVFRNSVSFPQAMRDLSRAATVGVLAQCSIGGIQYFDLGFQALPGSPFLPQGTLANKNVFAAWIAMALPLSAFALMDESQAWRRTSMAAVVAAISLVAVSFSRTGWLILAGFLAAGIFAAWFLRGSNEGRDLSRVLVVGVMAAFLVLLWDMFHPPRHLAYRVQSAYGDFPARFASIAVPGDLRNRERLQLWSHTVAMAAASPWIGIGAGSWKMGYPAYAVPAANAKPPANSVSSDPTVFPASPHNDFLLMAAESGVPGLLAYLSVFGAAVAMLVVGKRGLGSRAPFALPFLLASLGAYLVDATFNFPGERIEPALLLGLVLGTVTLAKNTSIGPGESIPKGGGLQSVELETGKNLPWQATDLVMAVLALGSLGLCLARWDADTHLRRGLEARGKGDWSEAERQLFRADRPWYQLDRSGTPVAFYRATVALDMGSREDARALLERAHSVNPLHIHVLHNLGSLEVASGHFQKGIAWYEKCLALRPDFTEARQNLAAAWFNAGQLHKAKETLAAIPPEARSPRVETYARKVDELLKEHAGYD